MNKKTMKNFMKFLKGEIVLVVSVVLAIGSMFLITPDRKYADYIDFRTLAILFSLMIVVSGLREQNVFNNFANRLLKKTKRIYQVVLILILLCFFCSMLITNDVALITFVPFTFVVLNMLGEDVKKEFAIGIVCMQTIAANLGSMLTPLGNPQNLYLYGRFNMDFLEFVKLILPYTVVSLALLVGFVVWNFIIKKNNNIKIKDLGEPDKLDNSKRMILFYAVLFVICILCVVRIIDYRLLFTIILISVLIIDRKIIKNVDYSLILTFVALFVFIGNLGRIESFSFFVNDIIEGNVVSVCVVVSQVISNVPAALLLSGFTDEARDLIVGVNLGGLGTLIASMASLISFRYFAKEDGERIKNYFLYFTFSNLAFLAILLLLNSVIG